MFFYSSSTIFSFPLEVFKLSENESYLNQAAIWAEEKWGYLRGYLGVEKRKEIIEGLKDNFYIVTFGKQPVGMFALLDYPMLDNHIVAKELMYFYVDEGLRGQGIGGRGLEMAKKTSSELGGKMMVFDTLNPTLNKFYEKHGARIVCESQLRGHPTTMLRL